MWFPVMFVAVNQENTTTISEVENSRRFDTHSRITIRAQADDNDADYTCEARHPVSIAPKRTSVILSVQCKYNAA